MVASQRIMQREDLAEILRELKNITPADIKQLEEARRKESALTDEELAKNKEARDYIAKYNTAMDEVKKREGDLAANKAEHGNNVFALNDKIKSENTRISDREARLNEVEKQLSVRESQLLSDRNKLDEDIARHSKEHASKLAELQVREKVVAEDERLNSIEADRISAMESKLKAKAQRLAAEAAS